MNQPVYTRTELMPDTSKIIPLFHVESVIDPLATQQQGRDIYKDEERVEIIIPGNQLNRPVERVTEEHKRRWPEQYKRFKDGQELAVDGVPLEHWPLLKRAQVLEFKAMGFMTVENIANASDTVLGRIMGGYRWRDCAKAYLDEAQAQAIVAQKTAEADRLNTIVSEQNAKIENLSQMLERVTQELLALRNAPHPLATHIPAQHDPMEAARMMTPQPVASASALDDVPMPRKKRA